MAGTDLRQGTGLQAGKIVTVDEGGNVGNGLGEAVTSEIITAGPQNTLYNNGQAFNAAPGILIAQETDYTKSPAALNLDLNLYTTARAPYKCYCFSYFHTTNYVYTELIFMGENNTSGVIAEVSEDGSGWRIDSQGILNLNTGGGARIYTVRLQKMF